MGNDVGGLERCCCSDQSDKKDVPDLAALHNANTEELVDVRKPTVAHVLPQVSREFIVVLQKTPEIARLGMEVDYTSETFLVVDKIQGGLAELWNNTNPAKQIAAKDKIISVNGVSGNSVEMTEVCKNSDRLTLVILRD
mmetsp:Transcript_129431/g.210762  ORF Transcript_129431/g.210762 Transcript_129431/m.210762 type:complete len:139 (-) Transcript_129431:42-458(-)